jgi:hypothetical protein
MLETAAFKDLRNYIKKRIKFAEYKVDSTWYPCAIAETIITNDGIVRIKCQVAHGAACTITGVRLRNADQEVWATKAVNVVIENSTTNFMQWFDFTITEREVS